MQLIHCTQRLLQEMGQKKDDQFYRKPVPSVLGSWYATLVFIDRRKCLLFANDKTLLNFIIPDVPRRQIRELDKLFLGFLQCILSDEGFEQTIKDKVQSEYHKLGYTKTESLNILGTMNDLESRYKTLIRAGGGICHCNLAEIIHKMNHVPTNANEQIYPIDELKKLFDNQIKAA